MAEIIVKVKCAYCEKSIDIMWADLPRQKRDFCCNEHHDKYKAEFGLETDTEVRLTNSLGTGHYRDNPPRCCKLIGISKCTECPKKICDKEKDDIEYHGKYKGKGV